MKKLVAIPVLFLTIGSLASCTTGGGSEDPLGETPIQENPSNQEPPTAPDPEPAPQPETEPEEVEQEPICTLPTEELCDEGASEVSIGPIEIDVWLEDEEEDPVLLRWSVSGYEPTLHSRDAWFYTSTNRRPIYFSLAEDSEGHSEISGWIFVNRDQFPVTVRIETSVFLSGSVEILHEDTFENTFTNE